MLIPHIGGKFMPWYKVEMSWEEIAAGKQIALQEAFANLFMVTLGPKGAGMFASADTKDNINYFSPLAAEIAKSLIVRYGGVECPAPTRSEVDILVASAALEGIPFSPEPKPRVEDNS
jgi:hypothetical protein